MTENDNLLNWLLYKGVLPRYAFPTDVASFYVFNAADSTPYKHTYVHQPSQGLAIALSQYAPGKEVWIKGKKYVSGALYSAFSSELYTMWQKRKWYYECSVCHYAITKPLTEGDRKEELDCPACGAPGKLGPARLWIRPPGFAHPVFKEEGVGQDEDTELSYATRAKLVAPTPVENSNWELINSRLKTQHLHEHLIVTNKGPKEEGYDYCTVCGLIEPTIINAGNVIGNHSKPFPDKEHNCSKSKPTRGIVLGTDFPTDILLLSFTINAPLLMRPDSSSTEIAMRTVCESLIRAATIILELEPDELNADYRPALTPLGKQGLEIEVFMYDTLSGGAGFSKQAGKMIKEILLKSIEILECCPADCDSSCYQCLRSFNNKLEHTMLDRFVAAQFLKYILTGDLPELNVTRIQSSLNLLCEDLKRVAGPPITIETNKSISIPGLGEIQYPLILSY